MSERNRLEARKLIREAIPEGKKFVAVHVRDSGFYSDHNKTTRNGTIWNYEEAFKYLIQQGYIVVRMGDPSMVPIDSMVERCGPNLFDYAHSKIRSPLLDCFLISDCEFYIGLASGIWSLAIVFEKPTILVNFYSAATGLGYGKWDLTTFKTLRYSSSKELVPFDKLFMPPFCFNPPNRVLDSVGVYLEDTSSEDILATVKEFLGGADKEVDELKSFSKEFIKKQNFAWGGSGNYSNVILQKYFFKNSERWFLKESKTKVQQFL
jgi:putative glycosyltransferase (TIGR04372 family)